MIKKIRSKLTTAVAQTLLRLGLWFNNVSLVVFAMRLVAWRATPQQTGERRVLPRVLCLGRTIFVDDVKAMARYSGQIEYLVVHLRYFDAIVKHFLTAEERERMTEENYYVGGVSAVSRNRIAAFLERLLPALRHALG